MRTKFLPIVTLLGVVSAFSACKSKNVIPTPPSARPVPAGTVSYESGQWLWQVPPGTSPMTGNPVFIYDGAQKIALAVVTEAALTSSKQIKLMITCEIEGQKLISSGGQPSHLVLMGKMHDLESVESFGNCMGRVVDVKAEERNVLLNLGEGHGVRSGEQYQLMPTDKKLQMGETICSVGAFVPGASQVPCYVHGSGQVTHERFANAYAMLRPDHPIQIPSQPAPVPELPPPPTVQPASLSVVPTTEPSKEGATITDWSVQGFAPGEALKFFNEGGVFAVLPLGNTTDVKPFAYLEFANVPADNATKVQVRPVCIFGTDVIQLKLQKGEPATWLSGKEINVAAGRCLAKANKEHFGKNKKTGQDMLTAVELELGPAAEFRSRSKGLKWFQFFVPPEEATEKASNAPLRCKLGPVKVDKQKSPQATAMCSFARPLAKKVELKDRFAIYAQPGPKVSRVQTRMARSVKPSKKGKK